MKNKIFENYFKKNQNLLEQEMFELPARNDFEAQIANKIEDKLDDPTISGIVKSQQGANEIYSMVLQSLRDPQRMSSIIDSVVEEIFDKLSDLPDTEELTT